MVSRLCFVSLFAFIQLTNGYGYDSMSVLETLVSDPQFSTLVAAVQIAFDDPGAVLSSVAPLTVFAPTNEVFEAVPEDALNSILADPEALKTILLRHIAPKKVVRIPCSPKAVKEAAWHPLSQGQESHLLRRGSQCHTKQYQSERWN